MRCACGCKRKAVQLHHVFYQQHVRTAGGDITDERNLVPLALKCHAEHHNRINPLPVMVLPDSVFEFMSELIGAGPAYEWLRRRYRGEDARLDRLRETSDRELESA